MPEPAPNDLRILLCRMGDTIRDAVIRGRAGQTTGQLSAVAHVTTADTIYEIDKISEAAILEWFHANWPAEAPVQIVMEGIEDSDAVCFPANTAVEDTRWKCIIDPIDGTRGIMHDKRSAWALAGIAPQRLERTRLADIQIAAMTEIPTTRQWRSDQISAERDGGIVARTLNVLDGTESPLSLAPSTATHFEHGFCSFAKFFPQGRTLTAQIEERLWDELCGDKGGETIPVFDDQYISTGGQFYEMLIGHDRLIADIRPLIFATLEMDSCLVAHPYDVCTALILEEAGVIYEEPFGAFPDAPLDTTSGVAWVTYANRHLAHMARPVLQKILNQMLA